MKQRKLVKENKNLPHLKKKRLYVWNQGHVLFFLQTFLEEQLRICILVGKSEVGF